MGGGGVNKYILFTYSEHLLFALWAVSAVIADICKETSLTRRRAAQIYGFKPKYLEGSLTTRPLSKTAIIGPTLGFMTSPPQMFDQVYRTKHAFSPAASDPTKLLVAP